MVDNEWYCIGPMTPQDFNKFPKNMFVSKWAIRLGFKVKYSSDTESNKYYDIAISGLFGGLAGLAGGSSRTITNRTQMALDRSMVSSVPIMAREEMFSYMIKEVMANMRRSSIAELGRYAATGKIISLLEKTACDE